MKTSTRQETARSKKPPRWVRQLNRVAELNRQADPLVVRQSLLENLDRLTETALARARTVVVAETGVVVEKPEPDLRTALHAQLAAAKLLGVAEIVMPVDGRELNDLVSQARRALEAQRQAKVLALPGGKKAG